MLFKKFMRLWRVKKYERQFNRAQDKKLNEALKRWGIDRY